MGRVGTNRQGRERSLTVEPAGWCSRRIINAAVAIHTEVRLRAVRQSQRRTRYEEVVDEDRDVTDSDIAELRIGSTRQINVRFPGASKRVGSSSDELGVDHSTDIANCRLITTQAVGIANSLKTTRRQPKGLRSVRDQDLGHKRRDNQEKRQTDMAK